MIKPKKNIANLYRTAGISPISRAGKIRLDKNERNIGFPSKIIQKIRESISDEMLLMYPEPYKLYKKMAEIEGLHIDNIIFNAGSDQSIKSIFETYISAGDKILLHNPIYAMYSVYANMFGATVIYQDVESDLSLDYDKFINQIDSDIKMVVIENPNGFSGEEHKEEFLLEVVKKAKQFDTIVVIDEAYYDFNHLSMRKHINDFDNLIVVRTFSKMMGLASARIGYLISDKENISNISKVRPMHELTQFSINVAYILLENIDIVQNAIDELHKYLSYFKNQIANLNLKYSNSITNFLAVKMDIRDDNKFLSELQNNNILIKETTIHHYRRVGVSNYKDIDLFISILKKYI